ncbi:SH3 domain-containing protein [Burkholderia sp. IT-111MI5]
MRKVTLKSMKPGASHLRLGFASMHAICIGVATAVVSLATVTPVLAKTSSSTFRFSLPAGGAIIYSNPSNPKAPLSNRSWRRAIFTLPDGTTFGLLPRSGEKNTEGTEVEPPNTANISPSGQYVVIGRVEAGTVWQGQGKPESVLSQEFCPVIEVSTGCITSNQTGEICGQGWKAGQPAQWGTDEQTSTMLKSDRPSASNVLSSIEAGRPADGIVRDDSGADNLLRCDPLSSSNRESYRKIEAALRIKGATNDARLIEAALSKNSGASAVKPVVQEANAEGRTATVSVAKATLFTAPDDATASRAYLVQNDVVTVLKKSPTGWAYVDYVNASGKHLLRWIKADQISIKQ